MAPRRRRNKQHATFHRFSWPALAGVLAATAISGLARAESEFAFKLILSETYIENLLLVPPDDPDAIDDYVTQLNPDLVYKYSSPRAHAAVHYVLQNLWYLDNDDFNDSFHNLDANGDWVAVPDWFTVAARGTYGQHIIDPQRTVNVENLFATANLTDYAAASVTPVLKHKFGRTEIDAEFNYGFVDYNEHITGDDTQIAPFSLDDSVNSNFSFRFGSHEDARIGWGLEYQNDYVDYDTALSYRYERAGATAGYGITPTFRLLAEGGSETDLTESTSQGGLDSSYWRAGVRWEPDQLTSLQALAGERFFGNTYSVTLSRETRMLKLSIAYTEEPTTESQDLVFAPGTAPAGQIPEDPLGIDTTRISPRAFVAERFEGNMILTGTRTEIVLRLYHENRDYLPSPGFPASSEEYAGGGLSLIRRLGPKTDLQIGGATTRTGFLDGGFSRDNRVDGTFTRRFSPTFQGALQASYLDRWGDGAEDYKAWFGTVRIEMTF
jgi:hypothetical protein